MSITFRRSLLNAALELASGEASGAALDHFAADNDPEAPHVESGDTKETEKTD